MAPSSSFPTLLIVGGIVLTSIVIGYILLVPTKKKEHQREVDERQGEKQEVIMAERIETRQMPTSESVPPSSLSNQYRQPPETEAAHSVQEEGTKEGEVIEPSTSLALPPGIPEKYARLAARDRAFYDGIMKLLSLNLDSDLLYDGMEALWKKYNKKQNLN